MNRFLFALPVTLMLASSAFAAGTTVINHSGLPIDELSAAAPGTHAWGNNLMDGMPEGSLDSGKAATVTEIADGAYDLRISAPDEGVLCYMSNVEIKGGKVELTADMGKACQ